MCATNRQRTHTPRCSRSFVCHSRVYKTASLVRVPASEGGSLRLVTLTENDDDVSCWWFTGATRRTRVEGINMHLKHVCSRPTLFTASKCIWIHTKVLMPEEMHVAQKWVYWESPECDVIDFYGNVLQLLLFNLDWFVDLSFLLLSSSSCLLIWVQHWKYWYEPGHLRLPPTWVYRVPPPGVSIYCSAIMKVHYHRVL